MSKFKSNPDICNCPYCQGVGHPDPSEVSSTGLLSVELPRDELARITSWGAGMQTMPDCYWDSDSKRLWSKLMKIRPTWSVAARALRNQTNNLNGALPSLATAFCSAIGTDQKTNTMNTIWKFTLTPHGFVEMPAGAKVLTTAAQGDDICIWAEVDSGAEKETRHFEVYGTGHEMKQDMGIDRRYVGTAFLGPLVFHVYERI